MDLRLIVSQSGLGKTSKILTDIEAEKDKSKIFIITPEQNGYNFEKLLCEKFNGTFNIDVLNFKSLTKKFSASLNISDLSISETVKLFYYMEIADKLKDTNNFLINRMLADINFIYVVDEMISEFKEYLISLEELNSYLSKLDSKDPHKEKMLAIYEIYCEYINLLAEKKQYDNKDYINKLILLLDYVDLSDCIFYIYGYYNFSKQEYLYIQKLIEKSKKTIISINSDFERYINVKLNNLYEGYEKSINYNVINLEDINNNPKYNLDIFRKSHEIIANINNIISNLKVNNYIIYSFLEKGMKTKEIEFFVENNKVVNYFFSKDENTHRYKNSEILHLVREYPNIIKSEYVGDNNNISIISANNIQLEVKEVARKILEIKNNNEIEVKNEDIAILYRDKAYEKYSYIFNDYNIPIHLDTDQGVKFHRLIRLLKNIFNFDDLDFINSILNVLKTGLVNFEEIYIEVVCSHILKENNLDNIEIIDKKSLSTISFIKYKDIICENVEINSMLKLQEAIKIPNLAVLEYLLRYKNVKDKKDLCSDSFYESFENYSSLQLNMISDSLNYILSVIDVLPSQDNKKVSYYIKKIDSIFNNFNIKMTLDRELENYDDLRELEDISIDRQVYSKVLNILSDFLDNVSYYKISYSKFKDILFLALDNVKYRSIPAINNMIVMSIMDLAKIENKKVVFILGFNQGIIPTNFMNNKIIDDNDKEKLMTNNIYLSPTSKNKLIDEDFVSYIALSRVKYKVVFSYSKLGSDYREQTESVYLETIKNIFPNIVIIEPSKVLNYSNINVNYYLENIEKIYSYKEYSYLYSKAILSYFELSRTQNKNIELLSSLTKLIIAFNNVKDNYEQENKVNPSINNNLSDFNDLTDNYLTSNYFEYLKNNDEFTLENDLREKYLLNNKYFNNFSTSKIQAYSNNPYVYFVKRILKVKEPSKFGINPLNSGNFYHKILEQSEVIEFIKRKGQELSLIGEFDDSYLDKYIFEIKKLVRGIIKKGNIAEITDFINVINTNKTNNYILNTMIERLVKSIQVEIKYNAISEFETINKECSFNFYINGNKIYTSNKDKEIIINLSREYNIPNISINGKIDRIDKRGENYLVVDYKSSETKFNLESFYYGEISQLLTYALALLLDNQVSINSILGVFYREIANSKKINDYRFRGVINSDLLLLDEFKLIGKDIMFGGRVTKKNEVDKRDNYQTYTSNEFEKIVNRNIENMLAKIEKIYSFEFGIGSYLDEQNSLFKYANLYNTVIEKEYEKFNNNDYKKLILNK